MTDTTMESMEAEYETAPGLSISTTTFDLGWPWTVLIQGHQHYTSKFKKMMTDTIIRNIIRKSPMGYRPSPMTLNDLEPSYVYVTKLVHKVSRMPWGVAESISGDTFATGSRINVLIVHAQTLSSQLKAAENSITRRKWPCLYRKMVVLNSNVTSDFNPGIVIW